MGLVFTDSIFVYNRIGVEKVEKTNDLMVDNKVTTISTLDTYYRINFDKRQFQELGTKLIFKEDGYQVFTSPKKGIDFRYKYYNGEKYTQSDTTINHKHCKIYRYVANSDSPLRDLHITLTFSDMKNTGVHIIPNLEDTFNGRFLSLDAVGSKGERLVLKMEQIQPLSNYWKKIISQ
jgi:hypothetical protein